LANTKSALKRIRISERRHARNQSVRSELKTLVKKASVTPKATDAEQSIRAAVKALDQAVSKGVIHKNNAARRKSRLMRKFNIANGIGTRTSVKQ
jgi:small subunit ribosomal protein S20